MPRRPLKEQNPHKLTKKVENVNIVNFVLEFLLCHFLKIIFIILIIFCLYIYIFI